MKEMNEFFMKATGQSNPLSEPPTLEDLVAARRATIRNLRAATTKVGRLRVALEEANDEYEAAYEDAVQSMKRLDEFIRAQAEA